jgi:hypothetical protein
MQHGISQERLGVIVIYAAFVLKESCVGGAPLNERRKPEDVRPLSWK